MYYMPTVTLRLTMRKKELLRHRTVSEALRQGIQLYLGKNQETFRRLEEFKKKNSAKISSSDLVKMIWEYGNR